MGVDPRALKVNVLCDGFFATQALTGAEADSYWCLCALLDGIQDHYTHAQPGIQRTVFRLQELVRHAATPCQRVNMHR